MIKQESLASKNIQSHDEHPIQKDIKLKAVYIAKLEDALSEVNASLKDFGQQNNRSLRVLH